MKKIEYLEVRYHEDVVGHLTLTPDNRLCVFQYADAWLRCGFSISPRELPLKPGTFIAKAEPFHGNFGIFEDSMPDSYGRYLLRKALLRQGVNESELSALDRLALVGNGGMGALAYFPVIDIGKEEQIRDFDVIQQKALEVLKEKQDTDAGLLLYNSGNSGGARPKAVFADEDGHWLVKFRHIYDSDNIGIQEFQYNEAARRSGITVPDFKLINGKYFATKRFDIDENGERIHVATAGALMGMSVGEPYLDYINLLALTGFITQDPADVEQMFRRMVFNYLMENKDDHCKNFSFRVIDKKWQLAPAYDLTLDTQGYNGEHITSVNGEGFPTVDDFIAVGVRIRMSAQRCSDIIEEIRAACGDLVRYEMNPPGLRR